jgi:CheY-like chemotaxis protein
MGHILVVEDDPTAREWLRLGLARAGYAVRAVADGRQALDYLRGGDLPTVIVLDLNMPVMDGWEFRREQQAHPVYATVPVIILSSQPDLENQAASLGVAACLRKPLEVLDALLKLIQAIDLA